MGNLPCPHRHGRVSGHDGASGSGARPARRISIAEVEQNPGFAGTLLGYYWNNPTPLILNAP